MVALGLTVPPSSIRTQSLSVREDWCCPADTSTEVPNGSASTGQILGETMSFSSSDLESYITSHDLPPETADYIRGASRGLSRNVGTSGYASIRTEYQSPKMGTSVNTESRTGELAFAVHLDHDPDVIGYYEQPPAVDCHRVLKSGKSRLITYRPDFLVLHKDGPCVIEIKPESKLHDLTEKSPDWIFEGENYRDLAAEQGLSSLGLPHKVVCISQLSKLRTANISLILQSLDEPCPDAAFTNSCLSHLRNTGVMSLASLAKALGLVDLSPLLVLLAKRHIFTELSRFSLTQPDACFIAADPTLLHEAVFLEWEQMIRDPAGNLEGNASRQHLPLARHLKLGLANLDALANGANGRSARRWRRRMQEGEKIGLSSVVSVTPKYHLSGNRNPKRPAIVLAYAEDVIRTHWPSQNRPTPSALYRLYKSASENFHPDYKHISKPAFYRILDAVKDALAPDRGGKRAANAAQQATNVEDRALLPSRPFELATCDHYLIDLYCEVLDANGMTYAMRPWLTVLRDCYTKSVLAFWITLKPPSRRNCALIIRQCLRLHGRLPETIITDHGAEFDSVYFSSLLAHCRVSLMFRPSAHPRFGSEAERFFGQFKDLWLSLRPGNTVSVKEVRSVSGSHRPERLACLSLLGLWDDLLTFNQWLDRYTPESSLASPSVLMQRGLCMFGCSGKKVTYDDTFVIASAVDDGKYALDRQHGIHIGPFHYWNPKLSLLFGRDSVDVRIDPEDPYRIYALVGTEWISCLASRSPAYQTQTRLKQAVEGVLVLDGGKARDVAKSDADRNLVSAILSRQSGNGATTAGSFAAPPPSLATPNVSPELDDLFATAAKSPLDNLETHKW